MLTVYKASAGSGKTFQLVVEYLRLLLKNPFNYKHILAVTFTNKATNEMKTRILEQLYLLASGQESDYLPILKNENESTAIVRKKAKEVLQNILHDYNRFSISTIDSFTQRVIKSFNRELGISPNYNVELDSDMILDEAVDNMLSKIGEDKELLKWLKEFSKEKIKDNYSQRIDDDIKALGKELFKENFQIFFPEDSESVYNRENLKSFSKELQKIKNRFEQSLKDKGNKGKSLIEDSSFSIDDFSYKLTGVAGYFYTLAAGLIKPPGTRVNAGLQESEKWYPKKHKNAAELFQIVENSLRPLLLETIEFFENDSQEYFSAVVILKELRMLGILTDLKEEIKKLLHEKGVLQISDSNLLLNKIIDQTDSPFIYEKTGNYFKHFMLDEFQDTSTLQWNNFKPLLINSLSEGKDNLVVGDVKQSIYRWRNSDWRILAEQIDQDFTDGQLHYKNLGKNWRSSKNIIDFNNAVFDNLKSIFESNLIRDFDDEEELFLKTFQSIYENFKQEPGKTDLPSEGMAEIQFLEEDGFKEESTKNLVKYVKDLQDKGIRASEIAILVRTNKQGTVIIEEFLRAADLKENKHYNLSVLSNESLFLHTSKGVLFVLGAIELLIDSENEIVKSALLNLWLDWLKPELQKRGKHFTSINDQIQLDFSEPKQRILDEDYTTSFEEELSTPLNLLKEKILLTSLDESIIQICSEFSLFEMESEIPFLQTLIDKAGELKSSLSNDLSNLLHWWNEKGSRTSVNVNEEVDSIRLMTVHKSKGLEFHTVLIPFLDWKTSWSGQNTPILWCRPQDAPFNQFPVLPVRAGSNMEKSVFKNVYYTEKINYIIDTFNLVYVAFTRAKSVLKINCPAPGSKSKNTGKAIHHMLKASLESLISEEQFTGCLSDDGLVFRFGAIPVPSKKNRETNSVFIKRYLFNDFTERLKLRITNEDFLIEDENSGSVKNTGKIIHDILSEIKTETDIEKACASAYKNGKINQSESISIQNKLNKSIQELNIEQWFDGTYTVLNERNLLSTKQILRPDRIMVKGNEAIVVDYKTGEIRFENHLVQVKRYAKTLKETGMEKVSGYLWYINRDEVEKVCEL